MNANGTGPVQLTSNDADDQGPAWSADGTTIGFHSFGGAVAWVRSMPELA
jgi:Tol biopolymer transport system component